MKRHLNVKNKIFILVFVLIILVIVGILVYSVKLVGYKNNTIYTVPEKSVLFASDYSSINTEKGGKIEKSWDDEYRYISNDGASYLLGNTPVIYDSSGDEIVSIGKKYSVSSEGTVTETDDIFRTNDYNIPYFFKLADRKYLIIYKEISDPNKTIYTKKYLIVDIDKQGNASLLNDAMNVKTINPIILNFDNYTFDVANEKLFYKESVVDLKQILGSTNEYVAKEKEEEVYEYDSKELVDSYNELVNDFTKYAQNHSYATSANNKINGNTTVIINDKDTDKDKTDDKTEDADNKTEIYKHVSLRGVVTSAAYIDVSYIVTDPENKYQAVYLLVTGRINNIDTTQKIILDKYSNKCRIPLVEANSEYTISLGYIEIVVNDGAKSLVDNIEDVINVRTKEIDYSLTVDKISFGKVYFTFKMPTSYAFESADITLIVDDDEKENIPIVYNEMISSKGFSSSFEIPEGNIYELRIKNARYNGREVGTNIYKKFTLVK